LHHPFEWWKSDDERKKILKKTFHEGSDDSEDEFGQPIYIRSKDENYLKDQKEI
tara:strand:- start:1759 stop:1920 length:162 start_codon:yes stop_codon:yes gene_type:complete